ncbi:hypothetical protein BGZ65_000823, partial [Modicella reniformis]
FTWRVFFNENADLEEVMNRNHDSTLMDMSEDFRHLFQQNPVLARGDPDERAKKLALIEINEILLDVGSSVAAEYQYDIDNELP